MIFVDEEGFLHTSRSFLTLIRSERILCRRLIKHIVPGWSCGDMRVSTGELAPRSPEARGKALQKCSRSDCVTARGGYKMMGSQINTNQDSPRHTPVNPSSSEHTHGIT